MVSKLVDNITVGTYRVLVLVPSTSTSPELGLPGTTPIRITVLRAGQSRENPERTIDG